ncbi:hypothetical protein MAPG_09305 [Magnaporthiopsis poae ATCC 64411]|uniref:Uncharacterized protein n=1 Tax=Magnaporthiopsis poae (strain ATCC 64411 / 73-15) TaxID=644358 RepID=A0A0C4E9L2_MAGP6|nr:hypothetical protein MAPG_09305 [Magnaporthiopsis poae ATCC 64411]
MVGWCWHGNFGLRASNFCYQRVCVCVWGLGDGYASRSPVSSLRVYCPGQSKTQDRSTFNSTPGPVA